MNVVILGSGKGTNALAVIKASQQNQLADANIVGIFTDNPGSEILKIASENDIINDFISPGFKKSIIEKNEENNWIQKISDLNPDLIVLAGFMRILSSSFINHFQNRIINLHPSLLPSFQGLNAIEQAFNKNVKITGCTVHWVNERIDDGEIIAQAPVRIMNDDELPLVRQKVQAAEHILLPWVIRDLALGTTPFPQ